jgi:hypothetical protein
MAWHRRENAATDEEWLLEPEAIQAMIDKHAPHGLSGD